MSSDTHVDKDLQLVKAEERSEMEMKLLETMRQDREERNQKQLPLSSSQSAEGTVSSSIEIDIDGRIRDVVSSVVERERQLCGQPIGLTMPRKVHSDLCQVEKEKPNMVIGSWVKRLLETGHSWTDVIKKVGCSYRECIQASNNYTLLNFSNSAQKIKRKKNDKDPTWNHRKRRSENTKSQTEEQKRKSMCPICGKRFVRSRDVKRHIRVIHTRSSFLCKQCGHDFDSESALRKHVLSTHTLIATSIQCPACLLYFADQKLLQTHMRADHCQLYDCRFCTQRFFFEEDRNSHEGQLHSGEEIPLFNTSTVVSSTDGATRQNISLSDEKLQHVDVIECSASERKEEIARLSQESTFSEMDQEDVIPILLKESPASDSKEGVRIMGCN